MEAVCKAEVTAFLTRYEQDLPYFYRGDGVPTIGIGLACFTEDAAAPLGEGAREAWRAAEALPPKMAPGWYAFHCAWRADPVALRAMYDERFATMEAELSVQFPTMLGGCVTGAPLGAWPRPAIVATCDVAWNTGANLRPRFGIAGQLVGGWPRLTTALLHRDWRGAAEECATHDGPPDRNAARKALYLSCLAV